MKLNHNRNPNRCIQIEKKLDFFKKTQLAAFSCFFAETCFFEKKQDFIFSLKKMKKPILNYFYSIMQYDYFQNYTIITCYIYYDSQGGLKALYLWRHSQPTRTPNQKIFFRVQTRRLATYFETFTGGL